MIYQYLEAKLRRFRGYKVILHTAEAILRKILTIVQIEKKTLLFAFAILRCCNKNSKKKRNLKLKEHSELNNFANMVAEIDIDMSNLKTN